MTDTQNPGGRPEPWCSCNDAPAEVGACCDHMHTKPGKVCARCGTPHAKAALKENDQ